ncbi:MAG: NAD(P)-dependent oxidoreductase [Bacteroidales bacterium]|nr:NAD(P)-dependent oxidoreductase [Bacteroidales bacterium]
MTHNEIWTTISRILNAPEPDFVYIPSESLYRLVPNEAEWCLENFRHNNIFDNSKAKRDLGFQYTIKFKEGATRCIDYLKTNNLIEDCAKYPFYDSVVEAWKRSEMEMINWFNKSNSK